MKSVYLLLTVCVGASVLATPTPTKPTIPKLRDIRVGHHEDSTRIVNGQDAAPGQFPWMGILIINGGILCGSALISDTWILTAGHCVNHQDVFSVRLGSTHMNEGDSGRVIIESREAMMHENFDPDHTGLLNNDIALIKLPTPAPLNDNIRPIALPSGETGSGVTLTPMGWGGISEGGPISETLRYTDMISISNDECSRTWAIFEGQICTKFLHDGQVSGTCGGDSGGPLVQDAYSGNPTHVGVVSFGGGCEVNLPQGFSRTSYFRDWIRGKTGV